jgi:uncharacterized membrane protein YjgN (DUF898 family)
MAIAEDTPPTSGAGQITSAPSADVKTEQFTFTFTGTGSEYFRIWIVNLLLSIATLGIYSAWAKVRKTRYFYDNTQIAGTSFDYHGNPIAILKGRIVAVLFFAAYNVAFMISEVVGFVAVIALVALFPWLIWKSLQFKLYNSSYRGIRFGFRGSIGKVYFVYLLLPVLTLFTVYLLAPLTHQRMKKIQHEESRYGGTYFSFHGTVGGFYKTYLIGLVLALIGVVVIGLGFGGTLVGILAAGGAEKAGGAAFGTVMLFIFALYAWIFLLFPVFLTLIQNLIWNNTELANHRFRSEMKAGRMMFIAMTNLLGIIVTLGLFTPFAQVRAMKYRIESMSLIPDGSLDDFVAEKQENASATGEGVADLLDFDLSL